MLREEKWWRAEGGERGHESIRE